MVRSGAARVVVGARSALFCPLADLGLIVIDEEHEQSYKQGSSPRYHAREVAAKLAQPLADLGLIVIDEEHEQSYKQGSSPRYHAREVAAKLAQLHGCALVLGSATPSAGLIVIDEEHEQSYKQGSSPRYHAREVAAKLAQLHGCALVLGSATPSAEALARCEAGGHGGARWTRVEMPERPGTARLPEVRREFASGSRSIFSKPLLDALDEVVERRQKAVLLHNRRGFASFLMCRECGCVPTCKHCSTALTYHERTHTLEWRASSCAGSAGAFPRANTAPRRSPTMSAPTRSSVTPAVPRIACGRTPSTAALAPSVGVATSPKWGWEPSRLRTPCERCCPSKCGSRYLAKMGLGTQQVEDALRALLPEDVAVIRMDADSTRTKGAHQKLLEQFDAAECAVLLGTQMIARFDAHQGRASKAARAVRRRRVRGSARHADDRQGP